MVNKFIFRTVAAFDVGQSTGVAIADLCIPSESKVDIMYCGSFTWYGRPLFSDTTFCSLFNTVNEVWVEYPAPNHFSKGINFTLEIAGMWAHLLRQLEVPVKEVLPGTWKNSPARTFDMANYVPIYRLKKGNELTRHEKDAFAIAYWRGLALKREHFGS